MPADWSTDEMKRNGHAEWMLRTTEKLFSAMREFGGLPSVNSQGYMVIEVPTLAEQARTMNSQKYSTPGALIPTGVVDFID